MSNTGWWKHTRHKEKCQEGELVEARKHTKWIVAKDIAFDFFVGFGIGAVIVLVATLVLRGAF